MKVTVTEDLGIQLEEVFSGLTLKTASGETMSICMRDSGFEFNYQGEWYSAKNGEISSPTSKGIQLISRERKRQIDKEGWLEKHDDLHSNGELANAGAVYAIDPMGGDASNMVNNLWLFEKRWLKLSCNENTNDNPLGRIRDLEKAGALIAAEIDRLLRLVSKKSQIETNVSNGQ